MRSKIVDYDKFINTVKAKRVTSGVLFERGGPHPEGLLSPDIFGITPKDKRVRVGYIKLNKKYITPLTYLGFFRKKLRMLDGLIAGEKTCIITDKGELVEDPNGQTGLTFFYNNFDKIKFKSDEDEADRVMTASIKRSFTRLNKNEIFTDKLLVVPLALRDINTKDGGMSLDELNTLYQRLINLDRMLIESSHEPLVDVNKLDLKIQQTLIAIFQYFKERTFGKDGLQRRKVMGRSIDFAARAVISAPSFKGAFGSSPIDLDTAGFPMSTILDTFNLHIIYAAGKQLRNWFDNGYFGDATSEDFEEMYSVNNIKDMIKTYVNSWGERTKKLPIPNSAELYSEAYINEDLLLDFNNMGIEEIEVIKNRKVGSFKSVQDVLDIRPDILDDVDDDDFADDGRCFPMHTKEWARLSLLSADNNPIHVEEVYSEAFLRYPDIMDELYSEADGKKSIVNFLKVPMLIDGVEIQREITLTEFFYIVAYEEIELKKRMETISRYPIQDDKNIVVLYVHVLSTIDTIEVEIDGIKYPEYPNVIGFTKHDIRNVSTKFHETIKMSNTLLPGLDADYDGDKLAVRSVFMDDVEEECRSKMNSPSNLFNVNGDLVKNIADLTVQTLFSLSLIRPNGRKEFDDGKLIVEILTKDSFDIDYIFNTIGLGNKYEYDSRVIIPKGTYNNNIKPIDTSIGRLLINVIIFKRTGIDFVNEIFTKRVFKKIFKNISDEALNGDLDLGVLKHTIKVCEDFGFRMSTYIVPSIDPSVLSGTEKLRAKREELLEKYKVELENNDVRVADTIEKELISLAREEFKDKDFIQWYESGAIGKMSYNSDFKVATIMVGAVPKGGDNNEFVVSTSNYVDGIKKNEIHDFANQAVTAAVARALQTAVGGHLAKQATAVLQSVVLDKHGSDCHTDDGIIMNNITYEQAQDLIGRYHDSDKLITNKNFEEIVGKTIKLRSPVSCGNVKLCNKCVGEKVYTILGGKEGNDINIGLYVIKIFTELVQKSLQKTHVMGASLLDISNINKYIV